MLKKCLLIFSVLLIVMVGCAPATQPDVPATQPDTPADKADESVIPEMLNVVAPAEPTGLDAHAMTAAAAVQVTHQIFESLYAIDRDYSSTPMLAADYPKISANDLVYTIPLRQGVKFHDGSEMTADDVIASLERWGQVAGVGRRVFTNIDSIKKVNDYEIEITLSNIYYSLVGNLSSVVLTAVIMPKSVIDEAGTDPIREDSLIVGTGPYKLAEWNKGNYILLEKFNDYAVLDADYGGLSGMKNATFEKVKVHYAPDPMVRLNGLLRGMYEYAIDLPGEALDSLYASGHEVHLVKPYWKLIAKMNTQHKPFDNPEIRRAAYYAINTSEALLSAVGDERLCLPTGSVWPPEKPDLHTEVGVVDVYDPEKARQMLKDAGYNNEPIILLNTATFRWYNDSLVVMATQLAEAGFNVKVETMDWGTLLQARGNLDAWHMVLSGLGLSYLEIDGVQTFSGSWPVPGWYSNETIDKLINEWGYLKTAEEKMRQMEKIQTQFYQDIPGFYLGDFYTMDCYDPDKMTDHGRTVHYPTFWTMSPK